MSQYLAYACYKESSPEIFGLSGIWDEASESFWPDGFGRGFLLSLDEVYIPEFHGPIWPNDRYMRKNKLDRSVIT